MLCKSVSAFIFKYCNFINIQRSIINSGYNRCRNLHISLIYYNNNSLKTKDIISYESFAEIKEKNKKTYIEMLKIFQSRDVHRSGHVEFIYLALRNMESFGVHKDVEVYKAIVNVLPKGKFIPTNIFQAEFMHYPKQQQCIIDLLEQMEDNGVMPDYEMEDILLNTFGQRGYPLRKFWRMMYWMPKFKNLSPWPLPKEIPVDTFNLAKLAVERMNSVDIQSKLTVFRTSDLKDALEDTWICSSQSPTQQRLLSNHNKKYPVYVKGAFQIWIRNKSINYFVLKSDMNPVVKKYYDQDDVSNIKCPTFNCIPTANISPEEILSVHEQEDGIIFALCVTGTSSLDSLLSWVRHLQTNGNPALGEIPIVFSLRTPNNDVAVTEKKCSLSDNDLYL